MLKPVYVTTTVRKIVHYLGVCEVCGSDFMAHRSDARHCGDRCVHKAYRNRRNAKLARLAKLEGTK